MIRGQTTCVAWRDGPCRVQSPTTSTRSRGYLAGVDAKGIASSKILSNLQTSKGSEKKLSPVPIDPNLNKAPPVHYYTCAHLSSLVQGTYYRDNTAARARVRVGPLGLATPSVKTRVFGPIPPASGLLKGAGSGPGGQPTTGRLWFGDTSFIYILKV